MIRKWRRITIKMNTTIITIIVLIDIPIIRLGIRLIKEKRNKKRKKKSNYSVNEVKEVWREEMNNIRNGKKKRKNTLTWKLERLL